ncbi:hypothetical protein Bbelb_013030 [Branchiostoma belcheri]|nr:hypothetical protein Bbelb_013030 [Branchiostoma belcheri]
MGLSAVFICMLFLSSLSHTKASQATSCANVCNPCRSTSNTAACDYLGLTYVPTNFPAGVDKIYLEWNELEVIPSSSFQDVPSATTLNLSYNKIREVERQAFKGMLKIRTIDLRGNQLAKIGHDFFGLLPKLTFLYLQNNSISYVSCTAFTGVSALLSKVYFSDNCLEDIPWQALEMLKMISEVEFDRNKIQTSSAPPKLRTLMLIEVSVRQNPWRCDCELTPFVKWLRQGSYVKSPYNLTCASPSDQRGKKLATLDEETLCGVTQTLDMKSTNTADPDPDIFFTTIPIMNHTDSNGTDFNTSLALNSEQSNVVTTGEGTIDYVLLLPVADASPFENNGPHKVASCIAVLVVSALGFTYFLYKVIRSRKTVNHQVA